MQSTGGNLSRTFQVLLILTSFILVPTGRLRAQDDPNTVKVDWSKVVRETKTTPTLQVVVNPPLRRGSPIHDNAFASLRDMQADYVRFVPWLPYPRLGVAELEPPKDGKTSWDFSVIDPLVIDFLEATKGHSVVLNFSTIPQWMFKTDHPVSYPADPNEVVWNYEQGQELRDPTGKELAEYFARVYSWYAKGGFTDEFGKRHESGNHYEIPYWEILNEPDLEHQIAPELYTRIYDETVEALRRVDPKLKFVGISVAFPSLSPRFFEYFLNPKNHKPGIPLDYISYHFYAVPTADQSPEAQQFTYFDQAAGFLNVVRYIETIRERLSQKTGTMVNEIGSISEGSLGGLSPAEVARKIPASYWNLSGALYAYIFAELSKQGIDVAGESQLVGYPTQFPTVSMVDWETGKPNARYWALKLLKDNFGPGDKLVESTLGNPYVHVYAVTTRSGKKRLLLVNKRDRPIEITLNGASGAEETFTDLANGAQPPRNAKLVSDKIALGAFSVTVVTLH